jgi:import inner membrane translocase subunit TIM21
VELTSQGGAFYFLYTEVFASGSKTVHFNRAVNRIKDSPRCQEVLGPAKSIKAYGEPTSNKWARARPLAASSFKDAQGLEHLVMHFNAEGSTGKGTVQVHLTKSPKSNDFVYNYLYLDVPGTLLLDL